MEKVFDIHVHYSFDIPMPETVEIFKEEFAETGTEKYAFLSMPHHANGNKLYLNKEQNVKGLFLKHVFAPNAYTFAGLVHPQTQVSEKEQAEMYRRQATEYNAAGYDGIKMLEGHPSLRKAMGIALDSPVYDEFYEYLEQVGMPILMHVADPIEHWDLGTASEYNKMMGRVYDDSFPSKKQLIDEVFGVLKKHPKLKLGLAHFGFMADDMTEAEKFFSYENTFLDITPGGSQLISISKNWTKWRAFWENYQDRILYGSDFYAFPRNYCYGWKKSFTNRPNFIRQFSETNEGCVYAGESFQCVGLEKVLRDKLYRDNFTGLLGEPKVINIEYLKSEIVRLLNDIPVGDEYYTKEKIIDLTNADSREKVINCYISDLEFMNSLLIKKE